MSAPLPAPWRHTARRALLVALALAAAACGSDAPAETTSADPDTSTTVEPAPEGDGGDARTPPDSADGTVTVRTVDVVSTIEHDTDSFTQGLVRTDAGFYESVGLYGQSALIELDSSGTEVRRQPLADNLFGEGLELVDDRLVQLTYEAGTALVYDATTFEEVDRFGYEGEGWGLCRLGDDLYMSNGSARLTRRAPDDFAPIDEVEVTLDGAPLAELNELECVDGTVWANVWKQDLVVGIDPASGAVHTVVDASALRDGASIDTGDVLNGIAYDADSDTFWLTGKNWPTLFEVRFVDGN